MRETNLTLCSWLPHSEEDCQICSAVSCAGKPKRRKVTLEVKGRPSCANVSRAIVERVTLLNAPKYGIFSIHPSYFLPNSMLMDLVCLICGCIPNQPFDVSICPCKQCIISCYETAGVVLSCPCDSGPIVAHQLHLPPVVGVWMSVGKLWSYNT